MFSPLNPVGVEKISSVTVPKGVCLEVLESTTSKTLIFKNLGDPCVSEGFF